MSAGHTDGMKNQVTFTFTISDPELSGEEIFEQVQMLMYEDFHGRAEVFYGSPDKLVGGDDLAAGALRSYAPESFTQEEARKLLKAIFEGDLGADEPGDEVPYSLRVSFTANRVLTTSELDALENAIAAQVEDPHVPNEDGDYVRAGFSIRNAIVDVES